MLERQHISYTRVCNFFMIIKTIQETAALRYKGELFASVQRKWFDKELDLANGSFLFFKYVIKNRLFLDFSYL